MHPGDGTHADLRGRCRRNRAGGDTSGVPIHVGFAVETDGRLPSGDSIEDAADLAKRYVGLRRELPGLDVVGGCCGTDIRHVTAICDAWLAADAPS